MIYSVAVNDENVAINKIYKIPKLAFEHIQSEHIELRTIWLFRGIYKSTIHECLGGVVYKK